MSDDNEPGFSEAFADQEPEPCGKCWSRGFFHWPLLADHKPTPVATAIAAPTP